MNGIDEKNEIEKNLIKLANKIELLYVERETRLIATKGRFNLFSVLLKEHDETRLHSRFIHHLLNPKANHDCENLFLNLFIDTVVEKLDRLNTEELSAEKVKESLLSLKSASFTYGRTEQSTDKGRSIDIYLKFEKGAIAIENKIWAVEQGNQIEDYAKFIKTDKENNILFYLTLDGKESNTADDEYPYFSISYKDDILMWLEACLQATYKHVNINQAIQQYQSIIKKLSNQAMENVEMNRIKKNHTR